jgi:hypothetical protein
MITVSTAWRFLPEGDRYELRCLVPVRTVSETNAREHWAKRHKRRAGIRTAVGLVVAGALAGSKVSAPCEVQLTRHAPSAGLDDDNLVSSLKSARDAVADALGVNDRDPRITWRYAQTRSKAGKWAVEVAIIRGGGVANVA